MARYRRVRQHARSVPALRYFQPRFFGGQYGRPTREAKAEESDEKGTHFIVLPNCRERITANILRGDPWYAALAYIPFWQRDRVENDSQEVRKRGLRAVGLNMPWKSGDQEKESISPERLWFLKLHHFEREQLMLLAKKEVWMTRWKRTCFTPFVKRSGVS